MLTAFLCSGDGVLGFLEDPAYMYNVPQREAELLPLRIAVDRAPSGAEAQQAAAALQQALDARSFVDQAVRHAVSALLSLPEVTRLLQVSYACACLGTPPPPLVSQSVYMLIHPQPNKVTVCSV